jgi:hypothetical protein
VSERQQKDCVATVHRCGKRCKTFSSEKRRRD